MAGVRPQGTGARTSEPPAVGDERRALLRMDDRLLLECRADGDDGRGAEGGDAAVEAAVAAFLGGPTPELLARAAETGAETWLVPWLMKLDWAMEAMLRALARIHPEAVRLPTASDVNLSGSGLRFRSTRPFRRGEMVTLTLVLPPFLPVQARGEIVRAAAVRGETATYDVAVRFSEIAADDRERIIRYILKRQAEILRARRNQQA